MSDLGARVVSNAAENTFRDARTRLFLSLGKAHGAPAERPRLALVGGASAAGAETSVRVALLPEGSPDIPMSEFTLMAATGLLDLIGDPAREPLRLPAGQLARAAGLAAFTAAAGLIRGGVAGSAHVSLLDVGLWLNWKSFVLARETGRAPHRLGRGAEWQVLACRDGFIGLVYREQDWDAVKALVGDPRLDDPGFDLRADRKARSAEIVAIVEERIADRTRADIMAFASAHRIPLGPVLTTAEVIDDPHSVARGAFVKAEGALLPRLPVLWNGSPLETRP
ncbi:CoA transferase [Acuticoccus mangrovi]|uniref:CoA transferase n=1 Tax=Acuticoccus mangrovi TaxID=2796142 RepID=A0A934MGY0_9HYPH|nr:CoA transferase [Acuticoccus mangrovi]MBJ3777073.1 CoA transferase [Acuticoccus mangrovi]